MWDPCFRFLWVLTFPYLIGPCLLVYWIGALDLPLSCSFLPHTAIHTIESFGNYPCHYSPWSWALRQLLICLPWKCSVFLTLSFLVVFLFLPPLLALSVPVLVWVLMFSGGVGVWPACVALTIFLNFSPGRLLVRVLLPFSSYWWELYNLGSVLIFFSYFLIGVPIGVLVLNFCLIGVPIGVLVSNFCQQFTFSFSSPFS